MPNIYGPTAGGTGITFDSNATASTGVLRDANARAQVADPSVAADIATKNYVDLNAGSPGDQLLLASCFR